jgi:hypothetical protein
MRGFKIVFGVKRCSNASGLSARRAFVAAPDMDVIPKSWPNEIFE